MAKYSLYLNDIYPVFRPCRLGTGYKDSVIKPIELSDVDVADFTRVAGEWSAWQKRLNEMSGGGVRQDNTDVSDLLDKAAPPPLSDDDAG